MKNVRLDSPQEIASHAGHLPAVVVSRVMPMSNSTGMTDDERAPIDTWFKAGAPTLGPPAGAACRPVPPLPFHPSSLAFMPIYDATLPYPRPSRLRPQSAARALAAARASPCSSC